MPDDVTLLEGPKALTSLKGRRVPLMAAERQKRILDDIDLPEQISGTPTDFDAAVAQVGRDVLKPLPLDVFQINVGKLCNMTCRHCHVDAGPDRLDAMMVDETVELVLHHIVQTPASTVDITGGAPELHPRFRDMVVAAKAAGKHVIDRCNLTILLTGKYRDLPAFLAEHEVEIVASLPHYRQRNTDAQRGDGAFSKSIEALRRLNDHGYGTGDPTRTLTLMSNPAGAYLAPNQASMQREWQRRLQRDHGVTFDRLFALNNMPISRFLEWLIETDNLKPYMERLVSSFNPDAVAGVMCRNTLSVGYDGVIYDCDFNQMLEMPAVYPEGHDLAGEAITLSNFDAAGYAARQIVTARHCFGCTAGSGSGCGGATA